MVYGILVRVNEMYGILGRPLYKFLIQTRYTGGIPESTECRYSLVSVLLACFGAMRSS